MRRSADCSPAPALELAIDRFAQRVQIGHGVPVGIDALEEPRVVAEERDADRLAAEGEPVGRSGFHETSRSKPFLRGEKSNRLTSGLGPFANPQYLSKCSRTIIFSMVW
jgi:hypothetical protein